MTEEQRSTASYYSAVKIKDNEYSSMEQMVDDEKMRRAHQQGGSSSSDTKVVPKSKRRQNRKIEMPQEQEPLMKIKGRNTHIKVPKELNTVVRVKKVDHMKASILDLEDYGSAESGVRNFESLSK
jgi:hypothetical protein